MEFEQTLVLMIEEYGSQLWLGFVTLLLTGFLMLLVKNFIQELAYYFRARMSDIGFGQRIYWRGEIFVVDEIKFKHIIAHDDKKTIHIPINIYITGVVEYPNHRFDDFDEKKYHQKPWDGKTERRKA